jgi:hypothetical protein
VRDKIWQVMFSFRNRIKWKENLPTWKFEISVILIFLIILLALIYNSTLTTTEITKAVVVNKFHIDSDCYLIDVQNMSYFCDEPIWGIVLKTDRDRQIVEDVRESFWESTPVNTPVNYATTIGRLNIVVARRIYKLN